ncbi:MAG: hypothetical protein ACMUIA_00935 [bacterium]
MSSFFSRSQRALKADDPHRLLLGLLLATLLMILWTAWFFKARIALYEYTEIAQVEIDPPAVQGNRRSTILPWPNFKVVAHFLPSAAFGRIRPGQSARMRLHNYPWTQYGFITAKVARVANEIKDGYIQAEFTIHSNSPSLIPLQPGLSGDLEVEVGHTTPISLILRAAGKLLSTPTDISSPSGEPGGTNGR